MLGHIKPKQFLFVFNPQLGKDPGDPDAHQRPHHGDCDCDQDADDLCGKEPGLAKDQPVPSRNWIDVRPCEQSGGNAAPDPANAWQPNASSASSILSLFFKKFIVK